jgi:hypothetical protein
MLRVKQAFQISIADCTDLRFSYMFFPEEHLHSVLGTDLPATHPPVIHLRTSEPFDLSKKEDVASAVRGMLGLRRYLLSGEAKVETLSRA